jgi:hypothetical protein
MSSDRHAHNQATAINANKTDGPLTIPPPPPPRSSPAVRRRIMAAERRSRKFLVKSRDAIVANILLCSTELHKLDVY